MSQTTKVPLASVIALQRKAAKEGIKPMLTLSVACVFSLATLLLSAIGLYGITKSQLAALVWSIAGLAILGLTWDSVIVSSKAIERLGYINRIHNLMKKLVDCFQELHASGPSPLLSLRIFSAIPQQTDIDPYLEAAASAHKIAAIECELQRCSKLSDDLPPNYNAAIEAGCLDETGARVTHEFQKHREGRPSEMAGWRLGAYEGSLVLFQNELMLADVLVNRFGLNERDVRLTLNVYATYRTELYRLAVRAGFTVEGKFAP